MNLVTMRLQYVGLSNYTRWDEVKLQVWVFNPGACADESLAAEFWSMADEH